jgi:hypothetical protein
MSSRFVFSLGYTPGHSAPCLGGLAFSLKPSASCAHESPTNDPVSCFLVHTQLLIHHKVCTEIAIPVKQLHSSLVLQATLALLSEAHFTAGFSCSVQCLSSPVLDRLNTPFAVFASVPSRVTAPGCVCCDALLPRNHHHNLHINALHRRPLHRITHVRSRRPSNWAIWRGTPDSRESTGNLIEAVRAQADMQDVQRGLRTCLSHWPLQITNQVRPSVCVAWSGRITARESSGRWL